MDDKQRSQIGIFDSGVGGLTVMEQLLQKLPRESYIYFGDTARLPYGNKSRQTIIRYSIENAMFLMEKNIKLLVVACNTASAFAIHKLRQLFNIPVIDVIGPGVETAISVTRSQRIAILGTKGTIQSGVYQRKIQQRLPEAKVFPIPCPLLTPLVEEQLLNHPATRLIIKEYLTPLYHQQVDTVLLGCTRYPLLKHLIQEEVEPEVTIVDSASTCAEQVASILKERHMESTDLKATRDYYVSDDPMRFREMGEKLFGRPLEHVELFSSYSP